MTLAPPSAAIAGMFILGEHLSLFAILGMAVTLLGIALSIMGRAEKGSKRVVAVKLPLKGVLFGIGAGVGQGVGLVFSKLGMNYYVQDIDPLDTAAMQMVPFASTQIRAIVGLIGFLLVMIWKRRGTALLHAFKDGRSMLSATGGTFFRPFSWCIFLAYGCTMYAGRYRFYVDGTYPGNYIAPVIYAIQTTGHLQRGGRSTYQCGRRLPFLYLTSADNQFVTNPPHVYDPDRRIISQFVPQFGNEHM